MSESRDPVPQRDCSPTASFFTLHSLLLKLHQQRRELRERICSQIRASRAAHSHNSAVRRHSRHVTSWDLLRPWRHRCILVRVDAYLQVTVQARALTSSSDHYQMTGSAEPVAPADGPGARSSAHRGQDVAAQGHELKPRSLLRKSKSTVAVRCSGRAPADLNDLHLKVRAPLPWRRLGGRRARARSGSAGFQPRPRTPGGPAQAPDTAVGRPRSAPDVGPDSSASHRRQGTVPATSR